MLDLDGGWNILTRHSGGETFKQSLACRSVFNGLAVVLCCQEIASDDTTHNARLRVALDFRAIDLLRDEGYRFALPPCDAFPFALAVNGNEVQRDAALLYSRQALTVGGVLSTWPQMLVWFARR